MEPADHDVLLERLTAADGPADALADLLLAAASDAGALAAHLDGGPAPDRERDGAGEAVPEPARVYLERIRVQGFRGVGPAATLPVEPGPGLTLVSGRNGSGKSSFAEALELLLTGRNLRWDGKPATWQESWRNLHAPEPCTITADLRVDGESTAVTVTRTWAKDDALDGGTRTVTGARSDWAALGWDEPLTRYRPLLSYSELGAMFSDRAADLYETLSAVLGLEPFEAVLETVRVERLAREKAGKDETKLRTALKAALGDAEDPRAAPLLALVAKQAPRDLAAIATLLGDDEGEREETATLQALVRLALPEAEALAERAGQVADAQAAVTERAAADAGRDLARAGLLREALGYHAEHAPGDATCPVCGAAEGDWAIRAAAEADALERDTSALQAAHAAVAAAQRASGTAFAPETPRVLREAAPAVDTAPAHAAWDAWATAHAAAAAEATPETVGTAQDAAQAARTAVAAAQAAAHAEIARREDRWRPLREQTAAWLGVAREKAAADVAVRRCTDAESWLKADIAELRTERMQPVIDAAQANWAQLRHESNVALGQVELRTSGNRRSVVFDVTVDGTDASAFGVMSQGELSALAISIFLPRASLPESPFGFVVIDDPVQSMDPAKVDGLAQVLATTAQTRQVVVLTHDDRLRIALERLQISHRLVDVKRRATSTVEVVVGDAPSARHLKDAVALALTDDLPHQIRNRVVPGFCRSAIEAACATRIRRRRLDAGVAHAAVEDELAGLTSLTTWLAAAVDLEPNQGNEIRERVGALAGDADAWWAVKIARAGAHEGFEGDAGHLITATRSLVAALERP